jgi:hypothetical protein
LRPASLRAAPVDYQDSTTVLLNSCDGAAARAVLGSVAIVVPAAINKTEIADFFAIASFMASSQGSVCKQPVSTMSTGTRHHIGSRCALKVYCRKNG